MAATRESNHRVVILNVDDYEAGRYATSRVLRQAGYDVIEAATGAEALEKASTHPDLVVLDVNLPDLDGFEVCRRLKEAPATSAIPVLYLSAAYRGPEHRVQGLDIGADGYLTQPVDGRELVATVNALLRARQVRDAVKDSEKRFRSLMTATSDIIWTAGPHGMGEMEQADWREFTGQTEEEARGDGWLDAVHPDERTETRRSWKRALEEESSYEVDYRLRRRDGEYRLMRVRAVPVEDESGKVREWVGACTDITEQRVAQDSLARHAHQLRELARASLAISSAGSLEGTLQAITDHARAVIGAHQAVTSLTAGKDWAQAVTAVSLSGKYAPYRRYAQPPDGSGLYALVCETNRPVRMTQAELEAHPRWPDIAAAGGGHPPMRGWLAAPLVARDGRNLGLIQLSDRADGDFTEQDEVILVQLAQLASVAVENTRLLEETQEANRAKSDFLATMSHELRTPLNAMIGYTDLLMLGVPAPIPEPALEHVERIRGAALHLTQLIEEVLTYARFEAGHDELHVERTILPDLIEDVAGMVEPLAREKGLEFVIEIEPAPVEIETDPGKLRQILVNLLGNAVKFTEAGQVQLAARGEGDQLVVEVSDTGIGIPETFLEKIFEPFWQVDGTKTRRAGGTGLGLGVVRQLARRLGGDVKVRSSEQTGSTFTVRLPLRSPPETEPELRSVPA
jgi:PAS domain S-box-containing protein